MKKLCFIVSHLYSGFSDLADCLHNHKDCQVFDDNKANLLLNSQQVLFLTYNNHKLKNRNAVYIYKNLYNYQIATKTAYELSKFIYLVRRPIETVSYLIVKRKMQLEYAVRYYNFRLHRICEMCKKTPDAVFLTYDMFVKGYGLEEIKDYLNLSAPIESKQLLRNYTVGSEIIPFEIKQELEAKYEKALYWIKTQTKVKHFI
jgi:hypothetical protein